MDYASIVETAATEAGFELSDDPSSDDVSSSEDTTPEPAPSSDEPADDGGDAAADATPPPAPTPEPSEEDELKAIEAELTQKNPSLNKGKLPVSRHQAILDRARRKHEAELKAATEKYARYEDQTYQQKIAALELAERNPEQFASRLFALPQYQAWLERTIASRAPKAPEGTAQAAPAAADEKPKPDYLFPDGSLGYTAEGQQKLLEWQERQLRKSFDEDLTKRLGDVTKQIEPFVRERQAQERLAQVAQQVSPVLESARRWPGFKEYEKDIHAEISKPQYEGLSAKEALERGYDAVVPGKLKLAEEQKIANLKAEWVKELNAKSRARTATAPSGAPATTGSGERSILDIVRETAAALDA
jgi:hypothetical protein